LDAATCFTEGRDHEVRAHRARIDRGESGDSSTMHLPVCVWLHMPDTWPSQGRLSPVAWRAPLPSGRAKRARNDRGQIAVLVGVVALIIADGAVLDDSTVAATLRDKAVLLATRTRLFSDDAAGAQMVATIDSFTLKRRVASRYLGILSSSSTSDCLRSCQAGSCRLSRLDRSAPFFLLFASLRFGPLPGDRPV
jgi:hypothetical protein